MHIGICDKDRQWCAFSVEKIQEFAENVGYETNITVFQCEQEIMEYNKETLDILFLSIGLSEEHTHIAVAKNINTEYPDCQIVFVSEFLCPVVDVYQVEHIYFVLKEQFVLRLPEVFDKILGITKSLPKNYLFTASWGRQIVVKNTEMYYLERDLRHTIIHTAWGDFQVKEKLDVLMESLSDSRFSRCHHSYIIYFPAIREKRKNSYILKNEEEIMISRKYMKQTNEDWLRWSSFQ